MYMTVKLAEERNNIENTIKINKEKMLFTHTHRHKPSYITQIYTHKLINKYT